MGDPRIVFDSFLFGYGLTLQVFNRLRDELPIAEPIRTYMRFEDYLRTLLCGSPHTALWRDFVKRFDKSQVGHEKARLDAKSHLCSRFEQTTGAVFENWVGSFLFSKDQKIDPGS